MLSLNVYYSPTISFSKPHIMHTLVQRKFKTYFSLFKSYLYTYMKYVTGAMDAWFPERTTKQTRLRLIKHFSFYLHSVIKCEVGGWGYHLKLTTALT